MVSRSASPTFSIRSSKNSGSGFSPAIDSGSMMFSSAVSIGSRLKNWKTKPMCVRRSLVRSVSSSVVISVPAIATVPGGRLVEPGEDVHQRRLAGAGRPHHGGQLAPLHLERDAAQRVDGRVTCSVAARDVACDDDGARLPCSFRSPSSLPGWSSLDPTEERDDGSAVNHTLTFSRRSADVQPACIRSPASASTSPRIPTISSNSAWPATSGGEIWITGSPRSSARQIRPRSNRRRREEAAQERLALLVRERLARLLVLDELERVEEARPAQVAARSGGRAAARAWSGTRPRSRARARRSPRAS